MKKDDFDPTELPRICGCFCVVFVCPGLIYLVVFLTTRTDASTTVLSTHLWAPYLLHWNLCVICALRNMMARWRVLFDCVTRLCCSVSQIRSVHERTDCKWHMRWGVCWWAASVSWLYWGIIHWNGHWFSGSHFSAHAKYREYTRDARCTHSCMSVCWMLCIKSTHYHPSVSTTAQWRALFHCWERRVNQMNPRSF